MLPMPRRDVERLHQMLALQPRLADIRAPLRAQRSLLHRHVIDEALTWMDIHGSNPDAVAHWRGLRAEPNADDDARTAIANAPSFRRRRRRRHRRPSPAAPQE